MLGQQGGGWVVRKSEILGTTVIVGASIAGLAAARVLSDFSRHVIVLEKDDQTDGPRPRRGVPQGRHFHVLLAGGCAALSDVFPGFEDDVISAGGRLVNPGLVVRTFQAGSWLPQRDAGLTIFSQTRPLLEYLVRCRLSALSNIELRAGSSAVRLIANRSDRISGVRVREANGPDHEIDADLVVDAAGRASQARAWLAELGFGLPRASIIHVEQRYVSCLFRVPSDYMGEETIWRVRDTAPSTRASVLQPVEGGHWIAMFASRFGDYPPLQVEKLIDYAASYPQPQIADRLRAATPVRRPAQYHFPLNVWWHYDELPDLPDGLVPIGDSIMSLNPVYGQGMTSALLQARALGAMVKRRASEGTALDGLAGAYLSQIVPLLAHTWRVAALGDFAFAQTTGGRPPDLEELQRFNSELMALANEDPEVFRLTQRLVHLLDGPEMLVTSGIRERVLARLGSSRTSESSARPS